MRNRIRGIYQFVLVFVPFFFLLSSCRTSKPVPYLAGNLDSLSLKEVKIPEPVIQKGDILGITIFSDNPGNTIIYNQAGVAGAGTEQASTEPTYLVDQNGNIRLHAIGILHVEGMTKNQLSAAIIEKLIPLQSLLNPYCIIRFVNFKITVIGEVKSQGVYTIPGEKATVLEAVGLAGGLTDFGRKDNVLLIREKNGERSFARMDLSKEDVISSPYFFLQQNDVLIIDTDPKKQTVVDQQNMRNFTIALSIISTLALLANLALRYR